MIKRIFFIISFLLFSVNVLAANYYVDTSVTVQDIRVTDMYASAINANGRDYSGDSATVQRCYVDDCRRQGIYGTKSDNSLFTQNVITNQDESAWAISGKYTGSSRRDEKIIYINTNCFVYCNQRKYYNAAFVNGALF